ncbi:hypothetical protein KBB96_09435 [Luteolibacter ambystomatis]|uniref:Uncharacterized protein n=1 Tax=Luteolibacter ambystomatis TaxID=2824561 RepID=A0A975J333_9BACT|nr:hypothetical protein [Luteolibacter ambystomatis]QUE53101.1 hypothetical protein KBB96_09435 [Luteolibacter ambystomatis]
MLSEPAAADAYFYHPGMKIELGKSFDKARPFEDITSNGFFEFKETPKGSPAGTIRFSFQFADDYSQFYSSSRQNYSASAKWKLFKGKASAGISKSGGFSKRNVVCVISAEKTYVTESVGGDLKLSAQGLEYLQQAVTADNAEAFYETAGTEVVTGLTRSAKVIVVINFQTSSESQASSLKTALEASYGPVSGAADFAKSMASQKIRYSYDIQTYEDGIQGNKSITAKLGTVDPADFYAIRAVVSTAFSETVPADCPISEFQTQRIVTLPQIAFSKVAKYLKQQRALEEERDIHLERYYQAWLAWNQRMDEVSRFEKIPESWFSDNGAFFLKTKRKESQEKMDEARSRARRTELASLDELAAMRTDDLELPPLDLMSYVKKPAARLRAYKESALGESTAGAANYEHTHFHKEYYPEVQFPTAVVLQQVNRIILKNNDKRVIELSAAEVLEGLGDECSFSFQEILGRSGLEDFVSFKSRFGGGAHLQDMVDRYNIRNVYSWGGHKAAHAPNMTATRNGVNAAFAAEERNRNYSLEIHFNNSTMQALKIGNYYTRP